MFVAVSFVVWVPALAREPGITLERLDDRVVLRIRLGWREQVDPLVNALLDAAGLELE